MRCEIAWLEVAGDAATAKVVLDYPTFRFIDYLHLLKLEGRWAIVDKVYHREDRPAR
ncbi:MAG: putative lumazine-binding protein [Acidobacteria bacterium ADurb.Bin340]|nr:MAG: putative lumazine-binding protein [Acidobacteria bacterium ADurb.Bin340]